jgi:DNA-binding response OmpR family regulator
VRADLESVQIVLLAGDSAKRLATRLAGLGCEVSAVALTDHEAEHALRSARPDILLLEEAVAHEDFLVRARRSDRSCAIVAWLPKASSSAVAELLGSGIDEVLHDGMGDAEFAARLAASVRRIRVRDTRPLELGALRIDDASGEAVWAGQDLGLTKREREVLHALADSAGRTLPREVLYKRVWGYAMARGDRSVDVNVKRLRAKLARHAGESVEIKTQPGIGYRLEVAQLAEIAQAVTTL